MMFSHVPVLLQEVVNALFVKSGKKYIDATLGGGGHAKEILRRGGLVLGIDQDKEAIAHVKDEKPNIDNGKNLTLAQGNFSEIEKIASENGFGDASGILFDLGMSSFQIEESGRGFSFLREEPLDMRMDTSNELTASRVINRYGEEELYSIFSKLGEERYAREFSKAIVEVRKEKPIETSLELARIIEEVVPRSGEIHPATRVFMALRIVVNDELENVKKGLRGALTTLDHKGRILVISFHSLEDRVVKLTFKEFEKQNEGIIITKKPILPSDMEIKKNLRSRSSKLRVFEKA